MTAGGHIHHRRTQSKAGHGCTDVAGGGNCRCGREDACITGYFCKAASWCVQRYRTRAELTELAVDSDVAGATTYQRQTVEEVHQGIVRYASAAVGDVDRSVDASLTNRAHEAVYPVRGRSCSNCEWGCAIGGQIDCATNS